MNVVVVFDDSKYNNMDFRAPFEGNPGIGGTEYCFTMLIYYLAKTNTNNTIYVLHRNKSNIFNDDVKQIFYDVGNWKVLWNIDIDILIFRAGWHKTDGLISVIRQLDAKMVAWAHNFLSYNEANQLAKNDKISRVIFVSRQMYEHYIDHEIINKAEYIYNMLTPCQNIMRDINKIEKIVVYVGGIYYIKGFHLLAKEWKKIQKKVPDAKLYVIGTGDLYNPQAKLGKLGIADEEYEKKIQKYITDKKGRVLDSVLFLGKLGIEKAEIYQKTAVGIINPSGRSETFGLSAVEMELAGVPIVSYKKSSYPDIIKDKHGGYLCIRRKKFRNHIIELLKDHKKSYYMGICARDISEKNFSSDKIIKEWNIMIDCVVKEKNAVYKKPQEYFSHDLKYLRVLNRQLRKKNKRLPSLIWLDDFEAYKLEWYLIQKRRVRKLFRFFLRDEHV